MKGNPFENLGVEKDASRETIKRTYHKLAKRFHPDKNDSNDAQFKIIDISYRALHKLYHRTLFRNCRTDAEFQWAWKEVEFFHRITGKASATEQWEDEGNADEVQRALRDLNDQRADYTPGTSSSRNQPTVDEQRRRQMEKMLHKQRARHQARDEAIKRREKERKLKEIAARERKIQAKRQREITAAAKKRLARLLAEQKEELLLMLEKKVLELDTSIRKKDVMIATLKANARKKEAFQKANLDRLNALAASRAQRIQELEAILNSGQNTEQQQSRQEDSWTYICAFCKAPFPNEVDLRSHVRVVHM